VLESLEPGLTVSGRSTIDATIRGRPANPEAYGKLAFKDASFYLRDVPNGLNNVSGVVSFFRDRATLENITASTGGGRLTINGFVGYGGKEVTYRLQAGAEQVRVRYPEGVSTTANASLSLTGSSTRSLLSGTVTILRSGFTTKLDLAGLVGKSSQPIPAPSTQNALLRGMQFDVRVNTSDDAKFETTLTQDVQAEADLRFRGTPYRPVLLGRVSITEGEVIFFGNRYSISRGDILFLNPVKIEPLLNFDLETRVRGIDVTISFAGTPAKPNVTYRSDPPLQPSEIIALLAVGRAPASEMTTQARQDQLGQDWGQLSASTVVGQALAAPVTGSLQRFFGVSRIRLDPRLTGLENNPQPQLMLEQQVTKDLTFTYITDLSNVEQQVIHVEWNINKQWAIQAVRQENGIFGVDILFRKQFK
jgi:translocation and assembly module TamB